MEGSSDQFVVPAEPSAQMLEFGAREVMEGGAPEEVAKRVYEVMVALANAARRREYPKGWLLEQKRVRADDGSFYTPPYGRRLVRDTSSPGDESRHHPIDLSV